MNPDDLARILDELGSRLGPTGAYVFELAVRQVYLDAAVITVATAIWTLATVLVVRKLYPWVMDGDSYSDRGMVAMVFGICNGVFGVFVLSAFATFAPRAFNPEYFALTDILGRVIP